MKRVLLTITGKVQGVGFRRYTAQRAHALGLTGYVCNLDNGNVEVLAQGAFPSVDQLIAECEVGPPYADVRNVLVEEDEGDEIYLDFSITG